MNNWDLSKVKEVAKWEKENTLISLNRVDMAM